MDSSISQPTTLDHILDRSEGFAPLTPEQWTELIMTTTASIKPRLKYLPGFGLDERFTSLLRDNQVGFHDTHDLRVIYNHELTQLFMLSKRGHWCFYEVDIDFVRVIYRDDDLSIGEMTGLFRQSNNLGYCVYSMLLNFVQEALSVVQSRCQTLEMAVAPLLEQQKRVNALYE